MTRCPICEGDELVAVGTLRDHDTTEPFDAARCATCWTTMLVEPPVDERLGEYYELHGQMSSPGSLFAAIRAVKIRREIAPLADQLPPGARILDYGCGDGSIAQAFRDVGFDPVASDTYAPDGWTRHPIPYVQSIPGSAFGELVAGHGPFSAAFFRHVLEHLPDPVAVLATLRSSGTDLVGLVVPNALSPSARLFGERWFYWDPPRHLYGFAPQSVHAMARRAGFTVQSMSVDGLDSAVTSAHRALALSGGGAAHAQGGRRIGLQLTRPTGLLAAASSGLAAPVGSSIITAVLRRT